MKIFLDTANIDDIRDAVSWNAIDGITTNPTLVSREGKEFEPLIKEICDIVDGPISVEVIALDTEVMIKEARKFSKWHKNIVVKIPLNQEGLKAVKVLESEGIRCNVTLCFSPLQALFAAKAGASFVSPFIGRLDDISHTGMDIVCDIGDIYDNYAFDTEIIVASIRHPLHVLDAARVAADIATIPFNVLQKLLKHPLTDIGIERFLNDWKKLNKQ